MTGAEAGRTVVVRRLREDPARLGRLTAVPVVLIATLALAGWVLDIEELRSVVPGLASMKVNTAVCLLLLACASLLTSRRVAAAFCAAVVVVTTLTLAEYAFSLDLGIDELVFRDRDTGGRNLPGRMAIGTAVAMLALAMAGLALLAHRARAAERLATAAGCVGVLALLGYAFGVESLYTVATYTTIAVHTAASITLLCVSALLQVPGGGLPWLLNDRGLGATVMRRMAPVALVLIPVAALLEKAGERAGWYDARFGGSVTVLLTAILVTATSWALARRIDRVDRARASAVRDLQQLTDQLVEGRDEAWRRADELAIDLDEERQRYERVITRTDDFVWSVEVVPGGGLAIAYASPGGEGLFGGDPTRAGIADDFMRQRVHREDAGVLAALDEQIRSGRSGSAEFRVVGLDGEIRWVWSRGAPRREGTRLFFDGVTSNITPRKQLELQREELLEQEKRQRVELERLEKIRSEFVAVVGHEMRAPITVIHGYAELLSADPSLTPGQRAKVAIIAQRTADLDQLTTDLFEMAQGAARAPRIQREPLALDQLLHGVVLDHQLGARAKSLTIKEATQHTTIEGDAARLRQVFDNLIGNAVKYSTPEGVVSVECHSTGTDAVVTVSDTGIGIPESELPHVFDRFARASTATDQGIPGTGLGLSVARDLVHAHGGTIRARSAPDHGTTIEVTLPRG